MKKRIGVVADDVTGANDIGVMFKKGGFRSAVFPQSLISLCDIRRDCLLYTSPSPRDTR